jgi:hypothetical protein
MVWRCTLAANPMLGYLAHKTRVPFRGRLNLYVPPATRGASSTNQFCPDEFQKLLAAYGFQEE